MKHKEMFVKMREMDDKLKILEGAKSLLIEVLIEVISGVIAKLMFGRVQGGTHRLEETVA